MTEWQEIPIDQASTDAEFDFLEITARLGDVFAPGQLTKTLRQRADRLPVTDDQGHQLGMVADAHVAEGQLFVKAQVPYTKGRRPVALQVGYEPIEGSSEVRLTELRLSEHVAPEERAALLQKAAALVSELREVEDQWLLAEAARQKAQYGHVKPWFMPKVHHLLKEDE